MPRGKSRMALSLALSAGVHVSSLLAVGWVVVEAERSAASGPASRPALEMEPVREVGGGSAERSTRAEGIPGVRAASATAMEVRLVRIRSAVYRLPSAAGGDESALRVEGGSARASRLAAQSELRSAAAVASPAQVAQPKREVVEAAQLKDSAAVSRDRQLEQHAQPQRSAAGEGSRTRLRVAPDGDRWVSPGVAQAASRLEVERLRVAPVIAQHRSPWEEALGEMNRKAQRAQPEVLDRPLVQAAPPPREGIAGALLTEASPKGDPAVRDRSAKEVAGVAGGLAAASTGHSPGTGVADPSEAVTAAGGEATPASSSTLPIGGGAGVVPGSGELARGDPNEALVLERITHVVSVFVGEETIRARGKRIARIRFQIDADGYVQDYELRESSHVREFDDAIEAILHLAEPFPVSERSYEIALPFSVQ